MMDRALLLKNLEMATDKAASFTLQRGFPTPITKKLLPIGKVFIEKVEYGYNVLSQHKNKLYENVCVFDVAIIIAQRYNSGETSIIKQVLYLENRFSKYHTDMIHYLNCMKSAKRNDDIDRLSILEDKFQLAEQLARDIRDKISSFKRLK